MKKRNTEGKTVYKLQRERNTGEKLYKVLNKEKYTQNMQKDQNIWSKQYTKVPKRTKTIHLPPTHVNKKDIPESVMYWPLIQADCKFTPGAKMSIQDPKLLNQAISSFSLVAPTVMARGACAGDCVHASS